MKSLFQFVKLSLNSVLTEFFFVNFALRQIMGEHTLISSRARSKIRAVSSIFDWCSSYSLLLWKKIISFVSLFRTVEIFNYDSDYTKKLLRKHSKVHLFCNTHMWFRNDSGVMVNGAASLLVMNYVNLKRKESSLCSTLHFHKTL